MIDTLKLRLVDYEVQKENKLIIQPASYQIEDNNIKFLNEYRLFNNTYGVKAYFNSEKFNFDIKPVAGSVSATVHISVPKFAFGNNFYSAGIETTRAVLSNLEQELREIGIKTNLQTSKVSRLDNFRNIQLENDFSLYTEVFRFLRMSNSNEKVNREIGTTTFLKGSKYTQICIYDKIQELKQKQIQIDLSNIARFELRLYKNTNIKSKLKIATTKELIKNYSEVKEYYKQTMLKRLFRYEVTEFKKIVKDKLIISVEELINFYIKYDKEYWLNKMLTDFGAMLFYNTLGSQGVEKLKEHLENREKKYRIEKKIKEAVLRINELIKDKQKSLTRLYIELKNKIVAA